MKKSSLLILCISLTGCALFAPKKEDQTYRYLTGLNVENASPQEVKDALNRETSMSGGNYKITAYPYTYTLIHAMVNEQAMQRGLTEIEKSKVFNLLEEKYLAGQTCFNLTYEVLRFKESSQFNDWQVELIDKKEQTYPMQWMAKDAREVIKSKVLRSGDLLDSWLGEGIVCTDAQLDLSAGFGLKLKPQFVQFPFDKSSKMYWEFPKIKVVDGKEVKVEGKSRNHKSYRGW